MATVAMSAPAHKHPLARLAAILLRRRYPEGALSPCCAGERLIQDPEYADRVLCPEGGELYRKAA